MASSVLIVGGGVSGLLTSVMLAENGHRCALFDRGAEDGDGCSRHAAGMLAPVSELDIAEPVLMRLGLDAVERWQALLGESAQGELFEARGSLLVAHRPEWPLLTRLVQRIEGAGAQEHAEFVEGERIAQVEPWLGSRVRRGLWVRREGVVHPSRLLAALRARAEAAGVVVHRKVTVEQIMPRCVSVANESIEADVVVDCRGLGARETLPVRGVRGEYFVVRPTGSGPTRPVRLMHPRYPLYIVPRPDGTLYVGATQLESDHDGPVHIRSALELLSGLYSLDSSLADAAIEDMGVGIRPAFSDNLPRIGVAPGLLSLNGMFRHGYLLAPRMCRWVVDLIEGRPLPSLAEPFVREE